MPPAGAVICCASAQLEEIAMETPSRAATIASHLGVAGVILLILGPVAIQLGLVSPFLGFRGFLLGGLCGLVALVLGLVGLWRTRAATGREGRGRAGRGALLGALILAVILVGARGGRGVPAINDITTNPDDPPVFTNAGTLPGNEGRDLGYPGADFATAQRGAYPDLAPIRLELSLRDAFERAVRAAEALGWEVTYTNPPAGTLEATQTSRIFRFVDDIAVRMRVEGEGVTLVDVRSKSRVGRGDMGANAARIRAFRERLTAG
jgi:uncharacterized protein (DUF1499 family)